jgi:hypothetical protein
LRNFPADFIVTLKLTPDSIKIFLSLSTIAPRLLAYEAKHISYDFPLTSKIMLGSANSFQGLNNFSFVDQKDRRSFRWSTGDTTSNIRVSPRETTTYTLTVTNGITTCTDQVTITVNQVDTALTALDSTAICEGASARLQAGSGNSYP